VDYSRPLAHKLQAASNMQMSFTLGGIYLAVGVEPLAQADAVERGL
jgi:hypothetical protein